MKTFIIDSAIEGIELTKSNIDIFKKGGLLYELHTGGSIPLNDSEDERD